jgi:hypothetical protein
VNAIQPLAKMYEGFLIHSRFGESASFGTRKLGEDDANIPNDVKIRRDVGVPVLLVETETDLINPRLRYLAARQPDSKELRTWEVAGASHADSYFEKSLGDLGDGSAEVAVLDPTKASGGALKCPTLLNAGAAYAVVSAAVAGLERWVRDGTPPPKAPRIVTSGKGAAATIVRDEHGIARGGIRTPIVDAPIATNDGEDNGGSNMCFLFGHTKAFDAATLAELYPNGSADYVKAFDAAAGKVVKAGYWLEPEAERFKAAARQITFG